MLVDMISPIPKKGSEWLIQDCDFMWKFHSKNLTKGLSPDDEDTMVEIEIKSCKYWMNELGATVYFR